VVAPFRFLLQSRWGDMDALHHVNNVRYVEYAQEARIAFFARAVGLDPDDRSPFVVVRQEVDYLRPLVHRDEQVAVDVVVTHLGNRSFTLVQTIRDPEPEGSTYARVVAVLVGFDPVAGSSRPLEDRERSGLTALLDEAGARA
jgi:acyl-CoA thioester hydrolase